MVQRFCYESFAVNLAAMFSGPESAEVVVALVVMDAK